MKSIIDLLNSEDDMHEEPRTVPDRKEKGVDDGRYSTIFHGVTAKLGLDTSRKITVFANVEGFSRGKKYCVLNYKKLSQYSGCTERELLETLEEFRTKDLVEEGEDGLQRDGWRLTERARNEVEPIRKGLNRIRAIKHHSLKA